MNKYRSEKIEKSPAEWRHGMKKMKQLIAVVLTLTLTLSLLVMPNAVFAEEKTDVPAMSQEDALLVEKLEAFGIIKTVPTSVDGYVTRREMAELICDYMRIPATNEGYTTSPFVDVSPKDSSIGAIVALYKAKIITGDGLNFYPDANLVYDDAIVMVINALGYKLMAVREGGYPTGYHRIAIKLGMLKGLSVQSGRAEITLRDVYKLFEAGLEADAVEVNYLEGDDANYIISETDDYLSSTYGITTHKGIVTGNENTSLSGGRTNYTDEQIEIDYKLYDTPGYVYATSLGKSVIYYLRDDKNGGVEIAYIEEDDKRNNTITIDAEDLTRTQDTDTRIYYRNEDDKEKHIDFIEGVDVLYNGRTYKGYGSIDKIMPKAGYIEALDNTGDNVYDILFVYEYKNVVVGAVDAYDYKITLEYTNDKMEIDPERQDISMYLMPENRKLVDVKNLAKDDVLTVMESKGSDKFTTIYVSRDVISGTVSEISDEFGVKINGRFYKIAPDCYGETIEVGMTADFYLDFAGKIAAVEYGDAVDESMKYAVMTGVDVADSGSLASELNVRLYTQDGTFLTAPLADTLKIDEKRYNPNGEDYEKVTALLCRNNKNNSGNYAIDQVYVVRYAYNNGVITALDTGATGKKGMLNVLGNDDECWKLLARPSSKMFAVTKDPNGTEVFYAKYTTSTIIFTIPSDLNATEEYGFMKTNELKNAYYIPRSGTHDVTIDSSALYSLMTSEVDTAEVVLLRGKSAVSSVNKDTSSLYVIEKVTGAVTEDGTPTKKLYFNSSEGKLLDEKVTVSYNDTATEETVSYNDAKIAGLKPGTVIQCGTTSEGYINYISVIATVDPDANPNLTLNFTTSTSTFGENPRERKANGTVSGVDTKTSTVSVTLPTGENVPLDASGVTVKVYRSSTEKVTTGALTELAEGDVVIFRCDEYFRVRDLIVIK